MVCLTTPNDNSGLWQLEPIIVILRDHNVPVSNVQTTNTNNCFKPYANTFSENTKTWATAGGSMQGNVRIAYKINAIWNQSAFYFKKITTGGHELSLEIVCLESMFEFQNTLEDLLSN